MRVCFEQSFENIPRVLSVYNPLLISHPSEDRKFVIEDEKEKGVACGDQ